LPNGADYAAAHPERVSHLVLHGPFLPESEPQPERVADASWFFDFLRQHWGTRVAIARRMVCAIWSQSASEEEQIAYMKQMRESMTPEVASCYARTIAAQNANAQMSKWFWTLVPQVATPTLIVHSLRDPLAPYEGAERLARVMPNAELLPLTIQEHGTGLSRQLDRIQARETRRFVLGD
jgi:pimeloyl-ACP methyl ester carboxylesterase